MITAAKKIVYLALRPNKSRQKESNVPRPAACIQHSVAGLGAAPDGGLPLPYPVLTKG